MQTKKTDKSDLEGKKTIFLEIGLILTLLIIWGVFEFGTQATQANDLGSVVINDDDVIEIPVTHRPEVPLPPPPPQKTIATIIEVVNHDVDNDISVSTEIDESAKVNIEPTAPAELPEEVIPEEPVIFVTAEKMPEFKGGDRALLKYIAEHVVYPEMAKENDIQGTVFVKFVVNELGKVTDVEILRGIDPLLDKEALKVIKSLPDWKPGFQSGKNVKVRMQVPIKFKLNN